MIADLYWRPLRRNWHLDSPTEDAYVVVPNDATLCEILIEAFKSGVPRGSGNTGIFQVQTDNGIYWHSKFRRMDPSTTRKMKNIFFVPNDEAIRIEEWFDNEFRVQQGLSFKELYEQYPHGVNPSNGQPFTTFEEYLNYHFKSLDQIPEERKFALEKCADLFKLSTPELAERLRTGSCCRRGR